MTKSQELLLEIASWIMEESSNGHTPYNTHNTNINQQVNDLRWILRSVNEGVEITHNKSVAGQTSSPTPELDLAIENLNKSTQEVIRLTKKG